jgi:DNA-binding beta-propeller fold protein YncE
MNPKKSVLLRLFSIGIFMVFFCAEAFFAQNATAGLTTQKGKIRTADEVLAAQEFRRGVQAYYRGAFNESVLQFEKSLSYKPDDNLILDWLGKSYYRSGMEGTALAQWKEASQNGYGGLLLQNRIEIVSERRLTGSSLDSTARYTEAGSFSGKKAGAFVFSGPVSVLPNTDGTIWVVAYGSNELLRIDVNGIILERIPGPLNGFDRPLDIIRLSDGNILISESAGDRLALMNPKGKFIKYISSKGRGPGQCIGPQYLAQDSTGNIYVTDYGNSRVVVFDKDGNGLFSFGGKDGDFSGFKGPSGIAVINESVYVADCVTGAVYEFDLSGNYLRKLVEDKTFRRPESMKVWGSWLIICDSNKVMSIDSNTGAVVENARSGNAPSRLTSAVPDINGNVIVTDLKSNEVYVMSKMQELVGGLFVQLERVNSDNFPTVVVELQVENRHRQPVVGLRAENFYLTEGKRPVSQQQLLGSASNNTIVDLTLLLDRSIQSDGFRPQMETAVREIAASMKGKGTLRIVSAGKIPVLEYSGNPKAAEQFRMAALKTSASDFVPLDLALRLAANDLVNAEKKRAIIFITAGFLTQNAFVKYGLSDTVSYLNNNSIDFSVIQLVEGVPADELAYLSSNIPGKMYYVFRPEGLSPVIQDIEDIPSGLYQLSYVSSLQTNFGESYLPVEAEAYFLNRSGRDETGYFTLLQ